MPTRTVRDAEYAFLKQMLGVTVGQIDDLRLKFYEGVVNGTISLGGGSKHDIPRTTRARAGGSVPSASYWVAATLNQALFYPVYFEQGCSINGLSMAFRGATATSVGRMGVFADNGSFRPGNILVQGTVPGTVASWQSTAVTSTPVPAGWNWFGVVVQVAAGQDVWSLSPFECVWFDAATLETAVRTDSVSNACLTTAGISGAFTSNPTTTITGTLPYRMAAAIV